jgi:hypothetical protein
VGTLGAAVYGLTLRVSLADATLGRDLTRPLLCRDVQRFKLASKCASAGSGGAPMRDRKASASRAESVA